MKIKFAVAVLSSLILVACGGGGGAGSDPAAAPTSGRGAVDVAAVGAYGGTLTGSTSTGFQMLILEDGTFWAPYGTATATAFQVKGFVQGTGTFSNGSFTSSDEKDFRYSPAEPGTIAGSYTATPTISGTVTYSGSVVTFNGTAIPSTTYDYNTPAQLSAITGAWAVSMLNGETANINVSNTGVIGGVSAAGCTFTGTVSPRSSGKNVYNVAVTFGGSPCTLPSQTVNGIGVTYGLTSGQHQLIVLLADSTRTHGSGVFGVR